MSGTPGWHPDPWAPQSGALRWWDGRQWTKHVAGGQTAAPAAPIDPLAGPREIDDATREHLIECFVGDYQRDNRFRLGSGELPYYYEPDRFEARTRALLTELQRQLPAGEPMLDLRYGEPADTELIDPLIVLTATRVLVLQGPYRQAEVPVPVEAEVLERVHLRRKGGVVKVNQTVVRHDHGLTLAVHKPQREWIEAFRSGPRVLQGRAKALLGLPRRAPGAPTPGWYPDPTGRFAERFWDGTAWCPQVARRVDDRVVKAKDDPLR